MASEWAISDLVSARDVEQILASQDGWTLAQALMRKCEEIPVQGTREQCRSLLGQLFRAGSQYLYLQHLKRLESSTKSDATGEY